MIAPQELWVFHQSVLSQFFMKQLVHVHLQAVPQLEKQNSRSETSLLAACKPAAVITILFLKIKNSVCVLQFSKKQPIRALVSLSVYLYVQRGKVAVQLFLVVDVRLAAHGAHHVSDVFVSHSDGEVQPEALVAHGALAGSQRLHLKHGEKKTK